MGEASGRRKRMKALLQAQPWCIYCGGVHPATTIDHMPPVVIFDNRQRPSGLEFPACEACNSGSKLSEQVVGLVSRMYPEPPNEGARQETKRLMREVESNHPGLLAEMRPTSGQLAQFHRQHGDLPAGTAPLNARGPLLTNAMNSFAAKFALAIHFEMTKVVVSPSGVIAARWYPNHQVYRGGIPDILLRLVGDPGTLVQGRKNVGSQFLYAGAYTPDKKLSFCTQVHTRRTRNKAYLRLSFASHSQLQESFTMAEMRLT
jgi:hypothetical protein